MFANGIPIKKDKVFIASECGPSQKLKYAQALIEQLRAEKNGQRNDSVYGMLLRTTDGVAIPDTNYELPLPGVVVKLQSQNRTLETKTDAQGVYVFSRLPKGTYLVSAELPADLELAQWILRDPIPPFELPSRSCYENDLYAMPTGKITGHVTGPDGTVLDGTSVELYRADQYREGQAGLFGYQGDSKPFEFRHLPAGEYILVHNRAGQVSPDAPFPRTFYPGVTDLRGAQSIRVTDGQQIVNADIHLPRSTLATRKFTVHLQWGERKPADYYPPSVVVKASVGVAPYPKKISEGIYTLNLLLNATYAVDADAICKLGTKGEAETNVLTVDGKDTSASEATLTFQKGECTAK